MDLVQRIPPYEECVSVIDMGRWRWSRAIATKQREEVTKRFSLRQAILDNFTQEHFVQDGSKVIPVINKLKICSFPFRRLDEMGTKIKRAQTRTKLSWIMKW